MSLQRGRVSLAGSLAITIYAPAALTGTVNVQVQPVGSSSWMTLQSAGSDIVVGAGKAVVINPVAFGDLRLASSAAEAADRAFAIDVEIDMDM
jgi:hypothetical protein